MSIPEYTERDLNRLWNQLGTTDVDHNDLITTDFLHFTAGTPVHDVWVWFDSKSYLPVYYRLYPPEPKREKY